jgi:hypothetical protein
MAACSTHSGESPLCHGLAILNWWPLPTISGAGLAYNYELTRPVEKPLGYQPVLRVDYQPMSTLRLGAKYAAYGQRPQTFLGNLPGFTDTRPSHMITPSMLLTGSYNLNQTTFLEGTLGHSSEQQEGCAFTSGSGNLGPAFCTSAIPQAASSNYKTAGFGDLPVCSRTPSDRSVLPLQGGVRADDPRFGTARASTARPFAWGSRVANAPPGTPGPGSFRRARDLSSA